MTSLIITIMSFMKALTDIITNIPAQPMGLSEILAMMYVSTFKIDVTLYLFSCYIPIEARTSVSAPSPVSLGPRSS